VVGATQGHIGSATACPDFGGWDTRVFPLAVDMGWGGALFATLRLARLIGFKNWRWWVVLVFEVVVAAFTIAGNAFHGAVVDGAAGHLPWGWVVAISSVASAVPGVVAVGSGFTLSVLVSTRHPGEGTDDSATRRQQEIEASQSGESEPPVQRLRRQPALPPAASRPGRPSAAAVLEMVREARQRLAVELEREPSDEEVASRVSANGHPITASRCRTYLAQLRAAERAEQKEVVAWRAR
jgi:hypothetical protein